MNDEDGKCEVLKKKKKIYCWNGEEFQARRRLYELKKIMIKVVNMGHE